MTRSDMDVLGAGMGRDRTGPVASTRAGSRTTALVPTAAPARRENGSDAFESEPVTAQIPVVSPGRPRPPRYASGAAATGAAYPARERRLPAPFALRLLVWLLFVVLLAGLAGLAVEREHPSWLDFARNTRVTPASAPPASSAPSTGSTTGKPKAGGGVPAGFHKVSANASGALYATGTASYSVVLTFANRVWTVVASPAGSHQFLLEKVLEPSQSPKTVAVNGSATVIVSARTTSLAVVSGGKTLGTITDPQVNYHYNFKP